MQNYHVAVKLKNGLIVGVISSAFSEIGDNYVIIDSGAGDKYAYAQTMYFDGGIYDDYGVARYKLVDGKPVLRSEEEIAEDRLPNLDTLRAAKQDANKAALADWLAAHPLTWTDGNVYGVTEQDQNEMAINLAQYQLAVAAEHHIFPRSLQKRQERRAIKRRTDDEKGVYGAISATNRHGVYHLAHVDTRLFRGGPQY